MKQCSSHLQTKQFLLGNVANLLNQFERKRNLRREVFRPQAKLPIVQNFPNDDNCVVTAPSSFLICVVLMHLSAEHLGTTESLLNVNCKSCTLLYDNWLLLMALFTLVTWRLAAVNTNLKCLVASATSRSASHKCANENGWQQGIAYHLALLVAH